MYGKSNIETDTIICKTDSQQEFDGWLGETQTGALYQPRGWDGEGDGRELQKGGGYMYTCG